MPGRRSLLAVAATVLGLVAVLPAAPAAAHEGSTSGGPARADTVVGPTPTRVIVKLRPGLGAAAEDSLLAGLGLRADRVLPLTGAVLAAADVAGEFPPGLPTAYVATGTDYPDALTGAALAGWQQAPVLLVSPDAVPAPTATALR